MTNIIEEIFNTFNLSYGDIEINLVKRFSKSFNTEIKHSALILGRCFDKPNEDNIERLAMYGIFNSEDRVWLKNLDGIGRYKFIIDCLNSSLKK